MSTNSLKQKNNEKTHKKKGEQQTTPPNKQKSKHKRQRRKKIRRHAFPIWLRILVVIALVVLCLVLGVIIGYGVIGDGEPFDALKKETWQHIIDIVIKD